jgi:hypothetical protein
MEKPKFYCRCSAIGQIMTEPQGKSIEEKIADIEAAIKTKSDKRADWESKGKTQLVTYIKYGTEIEKLLLTKYDLEKRKGEPNLSKTCQTYVKKWLWEKVTGKRVEFRSKPTDKGNLVEDEAIAFASNHYPDMELAYKNETHLKNEWIHGTPDVLCENFVPDNKSSYTHETFPIFDGTCPNDDYPWQIHGYLDLTGADRGAVIFTLMNMPMPMIEKEARYKLGEGYTLAEFENFASNYVYDDLEDWMRLKRFDIERDQDKIDAIHARVEDCRKYIDSVLWPELLRTREKFVEDGN